MLGPAMDNRTHVPRGRCLILGLFVAGIGLGCAATASHVVRRMYDRRSTREGACEHPALHEGRGPSRGREVLAVVMAECSSSREADCRKELEQGVCEAGGDALVNLARRTARGRLRLVGDAVEWSDGEDTASDAGRSSDAGRAPTDPNDPFH